MTDDANPIHRIIAVLVIAAGGWLIYSKSIQPLMEQENAAQKQITSLRESLDSIQRQCESITEKEGKLAAIRAEKIRRRDMQPEGSPMVWLHERIASHFRRYGMEHVDVRLNTRSPDADSPDYERTYWAVQLPVLGDRTGMNKALAAIADLSNAEPEIEMIALDIRPDANEDTGRLMVANIATVTRK